MDFQFELRVGEAKAVEDFADFVFDCVAARGFEFGFEVGLLAHEAVEVVALCGSHLVVDGVHVFVYLVDVVEGAFCGVVEGVVLIEVGVLVEISSAAATLEIDGASFAGHDAREDF